MRIAFYALAFFILTTCYLLLVPSAQAATYYWKHTGIGLSNNPSNWTTTNPTTCAEASDGTVPDSDDVVVFDADCDGQPFLLDGFSVQGITVESGFSGTVSQSGDLTIGSSGWTQADGTFTGDSSGNDYDITINSGGDFSLTGGTFTSTNDTLSTGDNFTVNGGTFNANNGTVVLDSSDNTVTITGSPTFNNLTFPSGCIGAYTYTVASGSTLTVSGTLSAGAGCGGTGIYGPGAINLTGNLNIDGMGFCDNTGVNPTVVLTINGTGSQSITGQTDGDYPCLPGLIINKTSGTLTISDSIEIDGNLTYTAGTVDASSSDILFNGASSADYTISGSLTLGTVRFSWNGCANSFTYTIASGTTLTASSALYGQGGCGTVTVNGPGNLVVQGAVNTTNNGITGSVPITLNGSSNQTITHSGGNFPTGTFTINKTSGTVTLASNLPLSNSGQDLLISRGTLDLASYTLTVNDTITNNGVITTTSGGDLVVGSGGVNNMGGGQINFGSLATCGGSDSTAITSTSGGSSRTWTGNGTYDFYDVAITDMTDQKSNIVAWSSTNNGNNSKVSIKNTCPTPPVADWTLDEGQGTTANDASGNSLNGTITSATWQTEDQCVSGKCLLFDGADDYVAVADNDLLDSGNLTVAVWVRANGTQTANANIIDKSHNSSGNTGWSLEFDSEGDNLYFWIGNGGTAVSPTTTTALNDNNWHYVVATHDGSNAKIYVDGELQDTDALSGNVNANANALAIGRWEVSDNRYFKGFIDQPRIYNYARTQAQIKADYNLNASTVLGINSQNIEKALSDGLVGYWKMDEASWTNDCSTTSVTDSSGNAKNGKSCANSSGVTTPSGGKFGNAPDFNGSNQYVDIASPNLPTGDFTYSAWVYPDSVSDEIVFMASDGNGGDEFYIYITGGDIRLEVNNVVLFTTSNDIISASQWTHLTVTRKGSTVTLYQDGAFVRADEEGTTLDFGSCQLLIGADTDTGCDTSLGNYMDGKIDEARVYNRALSSAEVTQLYNWAPGPVGYWKMDEATGTTAVDSSGNGYNGTLTNSPAWISGKYGGGLSFNGQNGGADNTFVDIGDQPKLEGMGAMTFSAWVYPLNNKTEGNILMKADAYEFAINDGSFSAAIGTQWQWNTGPSIPNNTWSFITAVWDGSQLHFYLNGVFSSSVNLTDGSIPSNNHCIFIGISRSCVETAGNVFPGYLDDVKIYDYARTQGHIIEDMNAGHPAPGSPVGSAVGHWKFDEGYGTTANNSGNAGSTLNGTLTDMASPATSTSGWTNSGKFGKALVFDGSGDYVSLGSNSAVKPTGEMSFSAWVQLNSDYTSTQVIASDTESGGENCAFQVEFGRTDNKFTYLQGCTTVDLVSDRSISDNNWHHIAVTRTGSTGNWTVKMYIDGQHDNTAALTNNPVSGSGSTALGRPGSFSSQYFNGKIDEVKLYGGALTADQIKLDFNKSQAQVLGTTGNNSNFANSAEAQKYCVPGDSATCTGPVGQWDFDEKNSSTAYDKSGNGNNGTISGATPSNGKSTPALRFDGTDDTVTVTDAAVLDVGTSDFTLSAWVKGNNMANTDVIFAKTNGGSASSTYGFHFSVYDSLYPTLHFASGNTALTKIQGTQSLSNNSWYHLVISIDRDSDTNTKVYIDGKPVTTTVSNLSTNTGSISNAVSLAIGSESDGGFYWDGEIDQVRIYTYALSAAQVAYEYNQGKPVAHWKMDECQGTTLNDSSGNNLHGTYTVGGSGSHSSAGTCTSGDSSQAWGDTTYSTGKRNYASVYDGDDYTDVGNQSLLYFPGAFTLSAWVKNSCCTGSYEAIISDYNAAGNSSSMELAINPSDKAVFFWENGGIDPMATSTTTLANNAWYHIVGTWDGTTRKIYVNGVLEGTNATAQSRTDNGGNTMIGRSGSFSGQYFHGSIDDVRIYNYPLTETQIKGIMNEGVFRVGPATGAP